MKDTGHISLHTAILLTECGIFIPTRWYFECEKIFLGERKCTKHNGNIGAPTLCETMAYLYDKLNISFDTCAKQGIGIEVVVRRNVNGTIETLGIQRNTDLLKAMSASIDIAVNYLFNKHKMSPVIAKPSIQ